MKVPIAVLTIILFVVPSWGYADSPPYEDEDILGLEVSGELLAPSSLVARIAQDLSAIRFAFPEISDIHVFPNWPPGYLLVKLTSDGWADYQAGTFAELDSLNSEYGPVTILPSHLEYLLPIEYEVLYHPGVLAGIYEEVDGVHYAEPNYIGGDGSDISCQLPIYTFKRGWGDCNSGCIYEDYWVFSVSGGSVDLIDHYGSSVSAVEQTPFSISATLHEVAPNPFNPSTTIKYHLKRENWIQLEIYDVRGRPIIKLVNELSSPGDHEVSWGGIDKSGLPAASGVYFCRLVVDGVAQVQEMTLLK